ncbi:hypothetical protein LP422_13750 [Janibacter limosus]|uniref:Uncharacterized protein n=1 Tax=Janibacter limosus TaxID=53458 RepID=A0AC61U998_9MICO|nr:hypothetical protein [Janibacter limosus]UUZ46478.1 hypothetical protein LP422_13750 [Janibacter limosus]
MDEPTGNLDEDTALQVSDALYALPGTVGSAVVVVTHDTQVAKRAERCISITRGTLNYHDAVKPGARGRESRCLPSPSSAVACNWLCP